MAGNDPHSTLPPQVDDRYATRCPSSSQGHAQPAFAGVRLADSVLRHGCRHIGNYVIERELGRGGMGVVYLATHSQLRDRRYAVKLISTAVSSDVAYERFRREVDAIGKSRHPNLLYAIDAGSHDGNPYLVTEFVDGHDIGRILRERGPLPPSRSRGRSGNSSRILANRSSHHRCHPLVDRPPTGVSSCRSMTIATSFKPRPTNCPRSTSTASERCRTRPTHVGKLRTGTRSAHTREKRHRRGCGAFRENRSGRPGRSSRGSRVAHRPEDR